MSGKDDYISRQAAIDAVESMLRRKFGIGGDLAEITLAGLPSVQPELKWIPCSERCPKEEQKEYWICTDTGYQCECRWTNVNHFWTDLTTSWHWHIMDVPQYTKVVAWMPLPEPYRGGDK